MAQIILIYPHKPAVSHSTVSKECYDGANESASSNLLVNRTVGVFFIVKPMFLSGMSYLCVAAYHATLLLLSILFLCLLPYIWANKRGRFNYTVYSVCTIKPVARLMQSITEKYRSAQH